MNINETLALIKAAHAGEEGLSDLRKSLTTASGIVNYDLQAPSKNLYPVITPLRNKIPRVGGNGGTATNWKVISGLTGSGITSMGWVPEGQRSGRMNYSATPKSATYVTLGEEDSITEEAVNAAIGFEDAQARMTMRLLQQTMIKEEFAILGGNKTVALGTPATPTLSAASGSSTLGTATHYVNVVALTLEGFNAASVTGGVKQATVITGADGDTYTLNGGSSAASAEASVSVTATNNLLMDVAAVPGAVGYAWYVGTTTGNAKLQAITTLNSYTLTALTTTHQNITAITADCSLNAVYAFDGLLSTALASGSGAYVKTFATGTVNVGTKMTTTSAGGVVEIDTMLKSMWDNNRVSPSILLVNAQEMNSIKKLVLADGASASLLRVQTSGTEPYAIVANGNVVGYYNPFAMGGGSVIAISLHPFVPAGTILAWAENLPTQYQSSETPNVAEMHIRKDYVQTIWPQKTRKRETGVYTEEVLAVYAPFAMGVLNNIAPS